MRHKGIPHVKANATVEGGKKIEMLSRNMGIYGILVRRKTESEWHIVRFIHLNMCHFLCFPPKRFFSSFSTLFLWFQIACQKVFSPPLHNTPLCRIRRWWRYEKKKQVAGNFLVFHYDMALQQHENCPSGDAVPVNNCNGNCKVKSCVNYCSNFFAVFSCCCCFVSTLLFALFNITLILLFSA